MSVGGVVTSGFVATITTFSIANDVAKYFAILPAMFVVAYPELGQLNVMGLATPESAILSAVILNALVIIALVPLSLRGVAYRGDGRGPSPDRLTRLHRTLKAVGYEWNGARAALHPLPPSVESLTMSATLADLPAGGPLEWSDED